MWCANTMSDSEDDFVSDTLPKKNDCSLRENESLLNNENGASTCTEPEMASSSVGTCHFPSSEDLEHEAYGQGLDGVSMSFSTPSLDNIVSFDITERSTRWIIDDANLVSHVLFSCC